MGILFTHKRFRVRDIVWLTDGSAQLVTDWQRYPGRPATTLLFPSSPRWICQTYKPRDGSHVWSITASKVLEWHVAGMRAHDYVFEPVPGVPLDRAAHQRWVRAAVHLVYGEHYVPAASTRTSDLLARTVRKITPHSFRGGLAVDLRNEKASWEQISVEGRWRSKRAVKIYASRTTFDAHVGLAPCRRIPRYKLLSLDAAANAAARRSESDSPAKRSRVSP